MRAGRRHADMFELPVEQVRRILTFASPTPDEPADPETIYIQPTCDRCKHYLDERSVWWDTEQDAGCIENDCPARPVAYIRADLFDAQLAEATDRMIESAAVYNDERELFIVRLVSLLERAREATDDHKLFSDIGELLPNLRPTPR